MGKKANRKPISLSRPESGSRVSNASHVDRFLRKQQINVDQRLKGPANLESSRFFEGIADPTGIKPASTCSEGQISAADSGYRLHQDGPSFAGSFEVDLKTWETVGSRERKAQVVGGKERILFVDDEEVLAIMVETMLRRLGYGVVSTTSSAEALRLFKEDPKQFDLVITDYTMPYLTGLALAKKLLTIRPDVPIILCTGFSENLSEEMVKRTGIKEFIQKPLVRREMAEAIRGVLDGTS